MNENALVPSLNVSKRRVIASAPNVLKSRFKLGVLNLVPSLNNSISM